jgi:hypothetical protein
MLCLERGRSWLNGGLVGAYRTLNQSFEAKAGPVILGTQLQEDLTFHFIGQHFNTPAIGSRLTDIVPDAPRCRAARRALKDAVFQSFFPWQINVGVGVARHLSAGAARLQAPHGARMAALTAGTARRQATKARASFT